MSTHDDEAGTQMPTCRCGYTREHHFVSPKLDYGLVGWFWILVGVNAMPRRVRYICRQCGETLESLTDKESLEKHRMGG